jgi:parvulin-like peptidyl-prolyl isomerase
MPINTKCKYWSVIVLGFLMMAGAIVPCFAGDQDRVVAIVNKDIITRKDLSDFLNFMVFQLSGKFSPEEVQQKLISAKGDILNRLIEDKLLLQEARKEKVYIDESRVKGKIEQMKAQFPGTREYEESISQQGLTPADVENKVREQLQIYSVIEADVKGKITVEPAEVTAFYQQHASELKEPEGRKVSALIMDDQKIAQDALDFVKKGGSFEDASKKYTAQLQDMGVIHKEQSRKEIEDAIFSLKSGEVSPVVKLDNNKYYLLKVDEIIPQKQVTLDDARDRIAGMIFEEKMQKSLVKWIDELKEQYYVEIKQD